MVIVFVVIVFVVIVFVVTVFVVIVGVSSLLSALARARGGALIAATAQTTGETCPERCDQHAEHTYNGWANRETWAAYLWLTSDEGNYQAALAVARTGEPGSTIVSRGLTDLIDDLPTEARLDIGSAWRIELTDIAEAFEPDDV